MKILHTADWHIGKRLYKEDLSDDFDRFLDRLIETIVQHRVELVLISGDIFDQANPSNEARKQYYRALLKLNQINVKVIVTGGNHDSAHMLNAPSDLLRNMNIHVVGELPENLNEAIIPIENRSGERACVVAAIPYLRDADLRSQNRNYEASDGLDEIRKGIQQVFHNAGDICAEKYPNVPALAMGHLFAAGVNVSDSERDIQVGNQAAVDAGVFGSHFEYVALGHIHKPQQVKSEVPIYYSGSPIPLSFSERKDEKRVLIYDVVSKAISSIEIPTFRLIKRISGTLEEVQAKVNQLADSEELETLVEIEMIEDKYDPARIVDLDRWVQEYHRDGLKIVAHRARFTDQKSDIGEFFENRSLEDLKPMEVFEKMLEKQDKDDEDRELLRMAFSEILDEVYKAEG
jgi:exonuclease SbcD